MKLYDYPDSGNGYKVRLMLAHLGLRYDLVEVDIMRGASRTPEFLAKNPNGRIPALELPDGTVLAESNAILFYLARDTPYLPDDRMAQARVLQWMFFEQYSHEPNIATSRFWLRHRQIDDELGRKLIEKRALGNAALAVMDGELQRRPFIAGARYTIADIALYAYTHVAPQGGFDLGPYPAVRAWIESVENQPGFVPFAFARQ